MANYVEMWKDLGMDLENHDLLCQVLPTAVGDVFLSHHLAEGFGPPLAVQCLIHTGVLLCKKIILLRMQPRSRHPRGTWMIPLNAARFPA